MWDKELQIETALAAALTLIAAGLAGWLIGVSGALAVGLTGAALLALRLFFARRRAGKTAALSAQIDRVLHGAEGLIIADQQEGELAVLQSEIHKMTLRLREQTEQLQADKRQLTEAIDDIFHQLRTPLTAMALAVSLLEDEELSFERRLELTRDLKRQMERMRWLIETLLKLSRLDAGTACLQQQTVALREVCEQAAAPFAIPLELRGVTLRLEVGDETFTGDLAWSVEAVGNLIKNAMEHTPPGGSVTLTAYATPLFTRLTVRDTGPGVDPADLPHLFERFYKGQGAAEGSIGIGLALCRSIVIRQNGTVTVRNAPDGGAEFTLKWYHSVV